MSLQIHIFVGEDGVLPQRWSIDAAGYDICASEDKTIPPLCVRTIHTDIKLEICKNFLGQLLPRSGKSIQGLITVTGVIDSDYRGEIKVIMYNGTNVEQHIKKHERISQLVILPLPKIVLVQVARESDLSITERNTDGFGSTGNSNRQQTAVELRKQYLQNSNRLQMDTSIIKVEPSDEFASSSDKHDEFVSLADIKFENDIKPIGITNWETGEFDNWKTDNVSKLSMEIQNVSKLSMEIQNVKYKIEQSIEYCIMNLVPHDSAANKLLYYDCQTQYTHALDSLSEDAWQQIINTGGIVTIVNAKSRIRSIGMKIEHFAKVAIDEQLKMNSMNVEDNTLEKNVLNTNALALEEHSLNTSGNEVIDEKFWTSGLVVDNSDFDTLETVLKKPKLM